MQTTTQPQTEPGIARFLVYLDDLNVRISRLAIALRIPLASDADVQSALKELVVPSVPVENRSGVERRSPSRLQGSPERRLNYQRAELRGLLVMRYDFEVKLVDELGSESARQVMQSSAQTLDRHGFHPGESGL